MSAPNPNRYAAPEEAMILRSEIAAHMEARRTLEKRAVSAATALHDTEVALRAAQEAHDAARRIVAYIEQQERAVDELVLVAQGLLHPIRRLPDEVLSMIFEVVPTFPNKCPYRDRRGRFEPRRPFVISAVCRRWRAVALSTPALWYIIHCKIPRMTGGDSAKRWALYLKAHCDRSRGLVLDVELVLGKLDPARTAGPFWRALSGVYYRSKRFTAVLYDGFTHSMLVCLSSHAPHLEELSFDEAKGSEGPAPPKPLALNAPCLKTFRYAGDKLPFSPTDVFHTVRTVVFFGNSFTAEDLANLFRICPGVVDLTVSVYADFTSPSPIVISAQRLETFNLDMKESSTMDINVAQCFSFPSLRTAYLEIESTEDLEPGVFGTFIASAFCTVPSLELKCNLLPGTEEGLAACVQLEHLSLQLGEFEENEEHVVLTLSVSDPAGSWICPQLRTLSVVVQPDSMRAPDQPGFADAMLAIATARCTAPPGLGLHPLQRLDVSFLSWYRLDGEDTFRIDALQCRLDTVLNAS